MLLAQKDNVSSDQKSPSEALVSVKQLTKRFGDFTALKDCDLGIRSGEVFGLLGPNGAGKSTLIRLLLGFLNPTSGSATIDGLDCHQQRVAVHERVAYLPGDARMYRLMRATKVINFFTSVRENASRERAFEIAERLELDTSRWVGFMSTGMRQKLALAVTLAVDSPLLILDEPTANLDPSVRGEVIKMVAEAKQAGRTVIFSSHVLSEIEDVCDHVGILRKGEMVHRQSLAELKRQHRIRGTLTDKMPPVPADLESEIDLRYFDGLHGRQEVLIETPHELSDVLRWLATAPLTDVYIQPVGLRAVYDQFHFPARRIEDEVKS